MAPALRCTPGQHKVLKVLAYGSRLLRHPLASRVALSLRSPLSPRLACELAHASRRQGHRHRGVTSASPCPMRIKCPCRVRASDPNLKSMCRNWECGRTEFESDHRSGDRVCRSCCAVQTARNCESQEEDETSRRSRGSERHAQEDDQRHAQENGHALLDEDALRRRSRLYKR